ncbi:hypothetical protein, partial [Thermovirga lienii]|uniref:hypothetical protein n=1 Tax=Thermovirga lienii TaxID=336261 RepID=UPI002FE3A0E8
IQSNRYGMETVLYFDLSVIFGVSSNRYPKCFPFPVSKPLKALTCLSSILRGSTFTNFTTLPR